MFHPVNAKAKATRNWRTGVAGAGSAAALGILFLLLPPGTGPNGLARLSYDLPFALRPDVSLTNSEVWVIYLDQESHDNLDQHPDKTWSRPLHTRLLQRLSEGGAKAVIFDLEFRFPSENASEDLSLAKEIQVNGRTVLAAQFESSSAAGRGIQTTRFLPVEPIGSAAPVGFVNLPVDNDGALRRHPFDAEFPGLAWKAAELLGGKAGDPLEDRWINYYGPAGIVPNLSYYAALITNLVPAAFFTNKIFLIGKGRVQTSKGDSIDQHRTAFTRWTGQESPGVEVQATILLNLLRKDWLSRLSPATEVFLVLLTGALFGFGLTRNRPWLAGTLALVGCLAIAMLALSLWWRQHLWFNWLIPCAIQIPWALGWAIFSSAARVHREKDKLEASLAAVRIAGFSTTRTESAVEDSGGAAEVADGTAPGALRAPLIGNIAPADAPQIPNYDLLRCIGQGAYGEVWLARDLVGTLVAVKVIYRSRLGSDAPYEREFRGLQRFMPVSRSHPGFVQILHVGRNQEQGFFYYVMEAGDDELSGQKIDPATYSARNLSNEIKRRQRFSISECVAISVDLSSALENLHQHQLIHRDIKPSNIIFVNNVPKFADIGLVTGLASPDRKVTDLGTDGYIPPGGPGFPAADVYSLGKVLYQVFTGNSVAQFPEIPLVMVPQDADLQFLGLNKIILKACEAKPGQRFQSAAEMRASLLQLGPSRS